MEKGRVTALTLLDLSAAFDTIDHLTLISRFSSWYGISCTALDCFTSYLSDRCQLVKKSGLYFCCGLYIFWCTPELCPWTYTFYSIYCSPQSRHRWAWCRTSSLCRWHTNLSLSGSEVLESLTDLKSCVTDVFTWMTNSKLKLDPSKTEFIIIGSKNQREKFKDLFSILLLDHDTLPKAFVQNLGFIFYCDFNFKR